MVNGKVWQMEEKGSWELLTFDPNSVADLLPGLRVTVFYFPGSGYNNSLFPRQCSEDCLIETHLESGMTK